MLDSNTILGTRGHLGCDRYEHGLISQNNDAWPCGAPVVYPANALKKDLRLQPSINVYTLMPPSQSAHGLEVISARVEAINPVGLKPLWNNHKVLTVSRFDIDKFSRLLEFIRDVGGISLVIEYEEGRKEAVESVKRLAEFFKYSSIFFYNSFSNRSLWGKDDRFVCVLTFLDIPYCIPLFNTQKVDGIGLSLCGATIDASKQLGYLSRTFRTDFIYTNHEENVFFMDGIAVNSIRSPDARIFDELKTRLSASLPIGKPEVKKGGYINYCSDAKMETTSKVWTKPFPPPTEADDAPDDGDVEPSLEEVASPSPIIDHGTVFDPNNPWHTTDDNSNKISWNFVTEPSLVVELQSENTEPEEGGN